MHEYSLVQALLEQVEALRRERRLGPATAIRVGIGALAGVEPELFRLAYEAACDGLPPAAALELTAIPLEAACRQCGHAFAVERFRFVCPACASPQVEVSRGDALILDSVTFAPGEEP